MLTGRLEREKADYKNLNQFNTGDDDNYAGNMSTQNVCLSQPLASLDASALCLHQHQKLPLVFE